MLDKHGIEPRQIELEFSEPVLMLAAQRHAATLDALRDLGFRMAINDFGDGYSCLGYLAHAPVQRLKLPRSLGRGALRNEANARAVRASVQVGRELGANVIADGVETRTQATFLMAAGCEQAQGPFFAPGLSAAEATVLLRHAMAAASAPASKSSSAA